jgi:hypothetical protein
MGMLDASGLRDSPPYFRGGDLAKSNHDIAIIRYYERLGSFRELPCSF